MSLTSRFWRVYATLWIVLLPILWWQGLTQDQVQSVGWHVGTMGLLAVSCWTQPVRDWPLRWSEAALLTGAVASSCCHFTEHGYSFLLLNSLIAWVGLWCLVRYAPSTDWILRRLLWLAWVNLAWWGMQHLHYDPILALKDMSAPVGLFGKPSHLAVLWLCLTPWCLWLVIPMAVVGNLTAVGALLVSRVPARWKGWAAAVGAGAIVWRFHGVWSSVWAVKVLPRLAVWDAMLKQIVWSPLVGYGMSAWNVMTPFPRDLVGYNTVFDALHAGGLLLALPLLWVAWEVYRSPSSRTRTSLLLLGVMGLTQDLWNAPRLIVFTLALYAAHTIGRIDAGERAGTLPQVS